MHKNELHTPAIARVMPTVFDSAPGRVRLPKPATSQLPARNVRFATLWSRIRTPHNRSKDHCRSAATFHLVELPRAAGPELGHRRSSAWPTCWPKTNGLWPKWNDLWPNDI